MISKKKTGQLDPRTIAANLPAPKPGMSFTIHSLEVLCLYAQIHHLKLSFRGDVVVATPMPKEEETKL